MSFVKYICVVGTILCVACSQDDPMAAGGSGGMAAGSGGAAGVGGTTAGVGGGTPPVTDQAFYPYVDGAQWVYWHSSGWNETVTMTSVDHNGQPAIELKDTPGPSGSRTESVLTNVGTAVRRVHKEIYMGQDVLLSTVDYDPGFTRFDESWASMANGTEISLMYMRHEEAMDGTVTDEPRVHIFTIQDNNVSVDVMGGSFSGCVQVHRARDKNAGTMTGTADLLEKQFWFCPGVGKVKELDLTAMSTEEMVSCNIPGGSCP